MDICTGVPMRLFASLPFLHGAEILVLTESEE
jgi:hypothetical protein